MGFNSMTFIITLPYSNDRLRILVEEPKRRFVFYVNMLGSIR